MTPIKKKESNKTDFGEIELGRSNKRYKNKIHNKLLTAMIETKFNSIKAFENNKKQNPVRCEFLLSSLYLSAVLFITKAEIKLMINPIAI